MSTHYIEAQYWASFVFFSIIGLLVGSFLNVVIYRLPMILADIQYRYISEALIEDGEKKAITGIPLLDQLFKKRGFQRLLKKQRVLAKEGFVYLAIPRSACPRCGHEIRWYENIPVISWLFLRGKCSSCHLSISFQYPLIELISGLLVGIIGYQYGFTLKAVLYAFFVWSLLSLALIDFKHYILPDEITLPMVWAGLILSYYQIIDVSFEQSFLGCIVGYMSLWTINQLSLLFYKKDGIGYGDFKLLALLGSWMGLPSILLIILFSSLLGAAVGISLIAIHRKKKEEYIPFGPYLSVAGLLVFYFHLDIDAVLNIIG